MRELLFRGKSIETGEWVFGGVCDYQSGTSIFVVNHFDGSPSEPPYTDLDEIDVKTTTVGQFTGLTDKNGTKIFEGDIVKTQPVFDKPYSKTRKGECLIGVVKYRTSSFSNSDAQNYGQVYAANWIVDVVDWKGKNYYAWTLFYNCEVVGNVYDNPELLEKK